MVYSFTFAFTILLLTINYTGIEFSSLLSAFFALATPWNMQAFHDYKILVGEIIQNIRSILV